MKLTEKQVSLIKQIFNETTAKDGDIARVFNVSRVHINKIRNGHRWSEEGSEPNMFQKV